MNPNSDLFGIIFLVLFVLCLGIVGRSDYEHEVKTGANYVSD